VSYGSLISLSSDLTPVRGWTFVYRSPLGHVAVLVAATTVGALNAVACGGGGSSQATAATLKPEYDRAGKLTRLEYDEDGDGKVDTWGYMDGARVIRVETDENRDGTVDRWEFHSLQSPGGSQQSAVGAPQMTVERVERATRFDGRVSRW
jgi:hypothetical protein